MITWLRLTWPVLMGFLMDPVCSTKPATFQELQSRNWAVLCSHPSSRHWFAAISCATKPNGGHETATPDLPVTKWQCWCVEWFDSLRVCLRLSGKPVITGRNDVTFQGTSIFINTAARAWNLGLSYFFHEIRGISCSGFNPAMLT
jgi:hypothetical protein